MRLVAIRPKEIWPQAMRLVAVRPNRIFPQAMRQVGGLVSAVTAAAAVRANAMENFI